ncbi:triose-phosphate isomerase [Hymenobacter arcticus]
MRQKIIVGNWKMNTTLPEATALLAAIAQSLQADAAPQVTVVVCPPALYLTTARAYLLPGSGAWVGAQNCAAQAAGAYTGEISASMLHSAGVAYVVVGHSERRHYFGETNEVVAAKVTSALASGLRAIFCCGESAELRAGGDYLGFVKNQLSESLFQLPAEAFSRLLIAYEPLWAIGTGVAASAAQAQAMHAALRQHIAGQYSMRIAQGIPLLYGGSVRPQNAAALFRKPDIDGGLIGGASLHAPEFLALVRAAQRAAAQADAVGATR